MAGTLPSELVDETRRTLDHVVRLNLPAPVWPAVGALLQRIDAAARAGDAGRLGVELATLRAMGLGPSSVQPSVQPARATPPPPPGYQPGAPAHRRSSVGWIVAAVVAVLVLGVAVTWTTLGSSDTNTGSPPTSFTQTPEPMPTFPDASEPMLTSPGVPTLTLDTPTPTGGYTTPNSTNPPSQSSDSDAAGIAVVVGIAAAVVLAAVAIVAMTMQRRGSRPPSRSDRPGPAPRAPEPRAQPMPLPAPHEIVELANRTVLTLSAHGGRA